MKMMGDRRLSLGKITISLDQVILYNPGAICGADKYI